MLVCFEKIRKCSSDVDMKKECYEGQVDSSFFMLFFSFLFLSVLFLSLGCM